MKTLGPCRLPLIALILASLAPAPPRGEAAPPDWKLVWKDEFDGTEIDESKWSFDLGNAITGADGKTVVPGWGNDELEYYTRRPENAFVRDGALHIVARKEPYKGFAYTSARLRSRKDDRGELFAKTYGRFEFRAKLPTSQGIWPALWMLPQEDKYGGWAASGEIDILEARGQEPNKILGTLHYGAGWPGNTHTERNTILPNGGTIADYHVYALEWEPGAMRWYVDDHLFATQTSWWSSRKPGDVRPTGEADLNPWPAPFDRPFFLVMNLAVGGRFLGNPDASTRFPAEMLVDYVRVYDKVGGYGPPKPRGPESLPFKR